MIKRFMDSCFIGGFWMGIGAIWGGLYAGKAAASWGATVLAISMAGFMLSELARRWQQ